MKQKQQNSNECLVAAILLSIVTPSMSKFMKNTQATSVFFDRRLRADLSSKNRKHILTAAEDRNAWSCMQLPYLPVPAFLPSSSSHAG